MEIILLKDIPKLGGPGDLVSVKPGYARNFLLPKKWAIAASQKNKQERAHQERIAEFARKKAEAEARTLIQKIEGTTLEIERKAGRQAKLYGSVSNQDIAAELAQKGIEIDRRKIILEEPIKAVGEFSARVRLAAGVETTVKVIVKAEPGSIEAAEAEAAAEEAALKAAQEADLARDAEEDEDGDVVRKAPEASDEAEAEA